jgi:hypothetical protein
VFPRDALLERHVGEVGPAQQARFLSRILELQSFVAGKRSKQMLLPHTTRDQRKAEQHLRGM